MSLRALMEFWLAGWPHAIHVSGKSVNPRFGNHEKNESDENSGAFLFVNFVSFVVDLSLWPTKVNYQLPNRPSTKAMCEPATLPVEILRPMS